MRSLSLAVALIFLRIADGSGEKVEELRPSPSSVSGCHFAAEEWTGKEKCLRQLCSFVDLCRSGIDCDSRIPDGWNLIPEYADGSYMDGVETPRKRGPITKNSFLFMKLHPVLNRVVDPNLTNVPTRYRRIGVRLGSEFLGKRSGAEGEEAIRRGRRIPGTELLGKRHGSEMLGKRNVEMLGKRGGEFLGKRSNEFLGKRSNEFLGKRANEFLGKRSNEFLGKRGNEFLGKRSNEFLGKRGNEFLGKRNGLRMWTCRDGEDCYLKRWPLEPKVLVQFFKLTTRTEVDNPEDGYHGRSSPPDRLQPMQINQDPFLFLEKL